MVFSLAIDPAITPFGNIFYSLKIFFINFFLIFFRHNQNNFMTFRKKFDTPPPTEETELLVTEWQKTKDKKLLEEILQRHINLIKKIASGYRSNGLDLHDLMAEGTIGLMHGLEKFRIDKKVKFSTYAYYWIKAKINLYAWKTRNLINVNFSNKNSFIFSILKDIKEEKISQEEGIHKIKEKEDMNGDQVKKNMQILSYKIKELQNTFQDGEEKQLHWEELLSDTSYEDMIDDLDVNNMILLIEECMCAMKENQRYVLNHRWLTENPISLKELAVQLDMSLEGVRKLEIKTLSCLREMLTSRLYHNNKNLSLGVLQLIFLLNIILDEQ